jgi:hypothetical protein
MRLSRYRHLSRLAGVSATDVRLIALVRQLLQASPLLPWFAGVSTSSTYHLHLCRTNKQRSFGAYQMLVGTVSLSSFDVPEKDQSAHYRGSPSTVPVPRTGIVSALSRLSS